ncbi:hypothetical protein [Ramlibacter tataouinensis]|uniref:Uncharacterized protein n=1 Tax=Ramlibacter tataouinensis (strain ATCC BAA-407 / DSM 14655 / LMG 21543 / TTB310) TaxID=365046 RepID=F5XW25_RAMTT|nr:hypothetical protein [Ramlibacter tataouinensis]AEG94128.1 hypothetical protein Rta_30190 [Ramlibacter tataouinensis TTB310]
MGIGGEQAKANNATQLHYTNFRNTVAILATSRAAALPSFLTMILASTLAATLLSGLLSVLLAATVALTWLPRFADRMVAFAVGLLLAFAFTEQIGTRSPNPEARNLASFPSVSPFVSTATRKPQVPHCTQQFGGAGHYMLRLPIPITVGTFAALELLMFRVDAEICEEAAHPRRPGLVQIELAAKHCVVRGPQMKLMPPF